MYVKKSEGETSLGEITTNQGDPTKKKNYQIILVGLDCYNGSNIIKLFHITHLMDIKSMITFFFFSLKLFGESGS